MIIHGLNFVFTLNIVSEVLHSKLIAAYFEGVTKSVYVQISNCLLLSPAVLISDEELNAMFECFESFSTLAFADFVRRKLL